MTTTYNTKAGDTADEIAWRNYGDSTARTVEQVLEANPGLADLGPLLPAGITVTLPDIPATTKKNGVKLWD